MSEFPDHGIIGEEFGNHNETAQYKWILDPIDGTKSFISGIATFGTLIGLLKRPCSNIRFISSANNRRIIDWGQRINRTEW